MLRVAIIGAGRWGPNLIRHLDNGRASEVGWIVDRDEDRLAQAKALFPRSATAQATEDALSDPSIDAVVVATPTSTHYPLARAALERGKHVLVEKPLTADITEGEHLRRLADEARLVLMVGHVFLYNPVVLWVRRYFESERLGRIYYIAMVRTNLGPIRLDVNAAWDLAAHDVSIANYWLGAEPESVTALGGSWINPGLEDAVFATLHYPRDVLVNLHVSWLNPRKSRDITIVGERQMLTVDDLSLTEPVRIYDKGVMDDRTQPGFVDSFASFRASVRDGDITIPKVPGGEPLKAECEHFLACIRRGEQPRTGAPEALSVIRTLDAIGRSMASGGSRVRLSHRSIA